MIKIDINYHILKKHLIIYYLSKKHFLIYLKRLLLIF